MKSLVIALVAFTTSSFAFSQTTNLNCEATYNSEGPFDFQPQIQTGERNKLVGELGEYKIYLSASEDGEIELQTLDLSLMMRSYASAPLKAGLIKISQWKRESLLEIRCETLR